MKEQEINKPPAFKYNRGYFAIGLVSPKTNSNIGSVLRAAGIYNAAFVATTGNRYRKSLTDTMKQFRHMPLLHNVDNLKNIIPYNCVPVAVDLISDAIPLPEYKHPERAFYIFGPEDGTLGKNITSWCRDKVYVPTKYCMNLAATVNVILYDRIAKQYIESKNNG